MACSICVIWRLPLAIFVLVSVSESRFSVERRKHLEMIFSNRGSLLKVDLETPENISVVVDGLSNAVALDYDFKKKLVVWTDVRQKGIYSADIDIGAARRIISTDVVTPDGLAVDWIHGNIYWTDTGMNTVSVASLDGQMRKLLFSEDIDEPRAIVVNPLEGWMFWTDWGAHAKIERSGMDGTQRSTIVSKDIAVPNGLTIDYDSRKIYWADVQYHSIRSSDYTGENVKEILFSTTKLGHPFAVDVFEDWLYWTDWRSHSVAKVHKITGGSLQTVTTRLHMFPMGLRIYHSDKQPKGKRYCGDKNAECAYLCLPVPKVTAGSANFTCACPDGKECSVTDVVTTIKSTPTFLYSSTRSRLSTASNVNPEMFSTTPLIDTPSQSGLQSDSVDDILREIHESVYNCGRFSAVVIAMLVILILVMSSVGFCIYKRSLGRSNEPGLIHIDL